jgi:hypothetical protein
MNVPCVVTCALCHEPRLPDAEWFQLVENRWTDRLKICRFQEVLAFRPTTFNVCGTAHLRELIVHWMTTGRLDFPFAEVSARHSRLLTLRSKGPQRSIAEPVLPQFAYVGELAVHRDSLIRILRENPHALSEVLEEVIRTIQPVEKKKAAAEPTVPFAAREGRVLP